MAIEVRPLERISWHGNQNGAEDFKRPIVIRPAIVNMRYQTGLDDQKLEYELANSKAKLTEREYYSKLLKLDLSDQYIPDKAHPVWDSNIGSVKLENNTMFFDIDENPLDHIKYKVMCASHYVANSMVEYNDRKYPDATHVIYNEDNEAKISVKRIEAKNQAILMSDKIDKDRKIELVLILGGKDAKGKSDAFVTLEFDKLVQNKAQELIFYMRKSSEEISSEALITRALKRKILTKDGHRIKYMDHELGTTKKEVGDYLNKIENQELKLRILAAIE